MNRARCPLGWQGGEVCGVGLESTEAALHGGDERVHALAAHVVAEVVKVDCPEHSPSKALCRYVCCLGIK